MKTDFDYIKEQFDKDGIKAPDSLSEDRIAAMLSSARDKDRTAALHEKMPDSSSDGQTNESAFRPAGAKKRSFRSFPRKALALAACAVIALVSVPVIYNTSTGAPDTSLVNGELYTFRSTSEIRRLVRSIDSNDPYINYDVEYMEDGNQEFAVEESEGSEAPLGSGAKSSAAPATGGSHSDTYLQVEEVDEADIVKTDGKYIYYVNDVEEVVILSAENGRTERVGIIGSSGVENYINNIYLRGNKLITIGSVYDNDERLSAVITYDITDRKRPEVVNEFRQTGSIVSSRMIGDYVYLVTSEFIDPRGRLVPQCTIDGEFRDLPAGDISCVPSPVQASYTILSAVDISGGSKASTKTKAVFGSASDIYCSENNLYTAVNEWESDGDLNGTQYTRIVRASLNGTDIRYDATARVRGRIDDQFSMDEHEGMFRIATTSSRDGMDVNNLYVLDDKMQEKGKITGFARDESIRAVRYMGDKAYVITYRQTDPLFVIDLSKPDQPVLEGEVKIEGFSTLLVPVSEGRLIGIGYDTDVNGSGGEYTDGLKLVLFDISDPARPEVLDSKAFKEYESPAQSTHHALTVDPAAGWYAIPYGKYTRPESSTGTGPDEVIIEDAETADGTESDTTYEEYTEPEYSSGVLVFGADDKISIIDEHELTDKFLYRSVYIDDHIYALDGKGDTYSFKVPQ